MSEVRIADEIRVEAPPEATWLAIEDPATQARWHPFVTEIAGGHELGEIRTCSVLVGKKPGLTKERCVERDDGRQIAWAIEHDTTGFGRLVTGWHAGFALARGDGETVVTATSTFRPRNILVRAMLPIIRRRFHQTQQVILLGLKDAVEASRPRSSRTGGVASSGR